jgi:hypothetical protein
LKTPIVSGNTSAGASFLRKLTVLIRSPLEEGNVEFTTYDRRKWMMAGVLVPLAVLLAAHSILNFNTPTSIIPASPTHKSTINEIAGRNKTRNSNSLDPTLHYAQLNLTENERYEGSGRNIFQIGAEARTARISPAPEPIPPAPAAKATVEQTRLRFFGFALIFNSPRKIFLSEGDAIFVGSEERSSTGDTRSADRLRLC